MPAETLLPSNHRLMAGLRAELAYLVATESLSIDARNRLASADAVINQLMLRLGTKDYAHSYGAARRLADEGVALLGNTDNGSGAIEAQLAGLPAMLDAAIAFDVIASRLEQLLSILSQLVDALDEHAPAQDFIERVLDFELAYFRQRGQDALSDGITDMSDRREITPEALQDYIRRRFPGRALSIAGFRRIIGGFQKTTIFFDLLEENRPAKPLVMRAEKPDRHITFDAEHVTVEYDLLQRLHDAGIPTAIPAWLESDPAQLGQPFLVTSRVEGITSEVAGSTAKGEDSRFEQHALKSFARTLGKLHALPTVKLFRDTAIGHWLDVRNLPENTLKAVESWTEQRFSNEIGASPSAIRLLNWLRRNIPAEDAPMAFVHVDYGPHNILVGDEGKVMAVLDWESCRIGDPAEDVSYLLMCLGARADRSQLLSWYHETAPAPISEERLRYFDAYNALKLVMSSAYTAALYETVPRAAIEWCNLAFFIAGRGAAMMHGAIAAAEALPDRRPWRPDATMGEAAR